MSDEEIRLEAAKLAIKCFVGCNGDRNYNSFSKNVTMLYDYIKNGKLPVNEVVIEKVLPSETDGKLEHQKMEDVLMRLEKAIGKNCILFRNLDP